MTTGRLFTSDYLQFLREIYAVGGVPCEDYPKFFFPEDFPDPETRQVATKIAKELCNTCPIKTKCFTYAIKSNQRHGIWAGTLPSER
jgi:WhiB family redox-sensing transcriptional regulator